MKKYISFMAFALMAVFSLAFVACSDDDDNIEKGGYNVALPKGVSDVTIEPLSDEEVNKLKAQGYDIIGTPVNVTQDGSDHVVLNDMATVSFKIPEDFPKEQYGELIGVLITEDGPEYIIPDLDALNEGIVRFKTIHFCQAMTVKDKQKLNDKFAEQVAIHGWDNDLRESDFNKLGNQLKESLDKAGLGENDLLGITMREVLGGNDYVNTTMEYIKHYDNGTLNDKAIGDISEKIEDDLKTKTLSLLFAKWKKDPNNKAVKECLKKYLTKDNMEKAGTLLGSESPTSVAVGFVKDFAVDKMKDLVTMNPYVKAFVKAAEVEVKAIDIFHKFWARNDMIYYYNEFEKLQKEKDDPNFNWEQLAWKIGTPKFEFDMTLEEMKEMFKNRYYNSKKINAKKAEVLSLIELWEKDDLLSNTSYIKSYFTNNGKQTDDYCMRLTRLHKLMERFRKELVVNGALKGYTNANTINELLSDIVWKYIFMYPDEKGFYKWLADEGYIDKKIEKQADDMDDLRSWWLVKTVVEEGEHKTGYDGAYDSYSASATTHTHTGNAWGVAPPDETGTKLYSFSFTATVEAPPAWMEAGDSIVVHAHLSRNSGKAYCFLSESIYYLWQDWGTGHGYSHSATWGKVTNLNGSTSVGTRPDAATSGSWDYVLHIPSGRKGQLKTIDFHSCGSWTHWVYRWSNIFEKDEPLEE